MPRRDETGPIGAGSMTGAGLGICSGGNLEKHGGARGMGFGRGFARRRGFGRGFGRCLPIEETTPEMRKELLNERKSILQAQLEAIDKQLEEK